MDNFPWLKFYPQDWMIDPKVDDLSAVDRICYITMMCLAHISKKRGTIIDFSEDKVIRQAKFKTRDEMDSAIGFTERMKNMLRVRGTSVTLPNFKKRQESQLTGYERVKKHREALKNKDKSRKNDKGNDNAMITLDIEEDIDKEEERIHTFDQFWSSYPKKVAKRKAELAWKKIKPSEHALIYADVQKRSASEDWRKNNGQFIPYPATYLNGERWKDQANTPSTAAPPKRICRRCKGDQDTGWMQGDGGWIHISCDARSPEGLQKLTQMKSELFRSNLTPKTK